jgi:hypothetical protein
MFRYANYKFRLVFNETNLSVEENSAKDMLFGTNYLYWIKMVKEGAEKREILKTVNDGLGFIQGRIDLDLLSDCQLLKEDVSL